MSSDTSALALLDPNSPDFREKAEALAAAVIFVRPGDVVAEAARDFVAGLIMLTAIDEARPEPVHHDR